MQLTNHTLLLAHCVFPGIWPAPDIVCSDRHIRFPSHSPSQCTQRRFCSQCSQVGAHKTMTSTCQRNNLVIR